MSQLLRTIAAYVPPNLVRATLLANGENFPTDVNATRYQAAVLFADVSGFGPLTEALGQKGSEGPEELTRLLNLYFGWMIAFIEREGGEVVKFGGDALTVVFPAIDEPLAVATRRAFQVAVSMQASMADMGLMKSSAGLISLRMKFGIGAGSLIAAQVGGVSDRWEYIIAGEAQMQAAQAEGAAAQNEIVLSDAARALLPPEPVPPQPLPPLNWDYPANPAAVEAVLRCYLPKPILTWLDKELHSWLATLRPMTVLFVGIRQLDYQQPDSIPRLHQFVRRAQKVVYQYQGSMPRLTVDDKGTVLLLLFGAPPYSHEDDPERAVRCALELQAIAQPEKLQLAIGVTTGRVFAGPVGAETRREYTVMGESVNLAARLMSAAPPGQIYCNYETYRSSYGQINFTMPQPVHIKGRSEPVQVYQPLGDYHARPLSRLEQSTPRLVGRQPEMAQLVAGLETAQQSQSCTIILEGEAGIGKTQLVNHLVGKARRRGISVYLGVGRSIQQMIPYRAWQDIFDPFFDEYDRPEALLAELRQRFQIEAPPLVDDVPLLVDFLQPASRRRDTPSAYIDTSRRERIFLLLTTLLRLLIANRPALLILEDSQWLDTNSWELAVRVAYAANIEQWPVLILLVTRPLEDTLARLESTALASLPTARHIRLDTLSPDDTLELVAAPVGLTGNELPEALAELIRERAGGNPYFAEEIFHFVKQQGYITFQAVQNSTRCLIGEGFERAGQSLPVTLHNTILTRLDKLPPEKQLVLKVAAVIGQMFAYTTLRDTLFQHLETNETELKNWLDELTYLGFIQPAARDPIQTYTFKHNILREVAYQTLLFESRRALHRTVAEWYEQTPDSSANLADLYSSAKTTLVVTRSLPPAYRPLTPYYSLLVYHWHQAEVKEREQYYAAQLGQQAVAQYANAEALGYLSRALSLTPPQNRPEKIRLLLARETIYNRRGDRERQLADLNQLVQLAEAGQQPGDLASVSLRCAHHAEVTGNYPAAIRHAQAVINHAHKTNSPVLQVQGYGLWARCLLRLGQPAAVLKQLNRAHSLAQQYQLTQILGEVQLARATWLRHQGDYTEARRCGEAALQTARTHQNLLLEGQSLNLLGQVCLHHKDLGAAQDSFEQAIAVFYFMGNAWQELRPLLNLGVLQLIRGHYQAARDYFEQVLDTARKIDDPLSEARAMMYLGLFYSYLAEFATAQGYVGQALGIQKELGYKAGEAEALMRLGQIYLKLRDGRTTARYCELALNIQQKIGNRAGERYTHMLLGHALAAQSRWAEATGAYERALRADRRLGPTAITGNVLSGLATVRLAEGQPAQAIALAYQALQYLERYGLEIVDDLLAIYLRLYQTLAAANYPTDQCAAILEIAYANLQRHASTFHDEGLQTKFLTQSWVNKSIMNLHAGKTVALPAATEQIPNTKKSFED